MKTENLELLRQLRDKFAMEEQYAQMCGNYFLRILTTEQLYDRLTSDPRHGHAVDMLGKTYYVRWHNDAKRMFNSSEECKFVISFRSYLDYSYAIIQHDRSDWSN